MCTSYKFNPKIGAGLTFLCMLIGSNQAVAFNLLDGRMQVHGFVAQSMINTSGNNFLGETNDNISFDFREIALNASYRALPDLQFSGQIMSHRAGESDNGSPDIDYAFIDWTALSGEWGRAGIRLGRVKNPYGLYNITRDVPFTRSSVLVPQSIYFERTRKLSVSADGINLYLDKASPWGTFTAEAVLGYPLLDDASEQAIIPKSVAKGDFETDFTQLYQLKYESPSSQWMLAVTYLNLGVSYDPVQGDFLQAGQFDFNPTILSAQYSAENWSLTGEYAYRKVSLQDFGIPQLTASQVAESYYLQGTYNVLPKWELVLRYEVAFGNRDDRDGNNYAAASGSPAFTQYTKDWTVGLRYDVTPSVMLRAEYHSIEGTSILSSLDNPLGPSSYDKHWDMWMLLASYRF